MVDENENLLHIIEQNLLVHMQQKGYYYNWFEYRFVLRFKSSTNFIHSATYCKKKIFELYANIYKKVFHQKRKTPKYHHVYFTSLTKHPR